MDGDIPYVGIGIILRKGIRKGSFPIHIPLKIFSVKRKAGRQPAFVSFGFFTG
jgi:hypothetical protein